MVRHIVADNVAELADQIGLAEGRSDGVIEAGEAGDIDVFHARQAHFGERLAGGLLDGAEEATLARGHEADGGTATASATGAADAVHVRFGVDRNVEVDHVADAIDVEAAGRDIRCHQNVELA